MPPCRLAAMAIVPCPLCGRQVTTKTLRYSHQCGRSFHTEAREEEQRKLAENAVRARMGQALAQRVEQKPLPAQRMEQRPPQHCQQEQPVKRGLEQIPENPDKYAHLFRHLGHGPARRVPGGF